MPWMEATKVDQRLQFVLRVTREEWSVVEACREFGVSRPTGYKWLERYEEDGLDGLYDRSRAPHVIPHKTDEQLEELICALRRRYSQFGPKKLRAWLSRQHPDTQWPAASTIGDILKRNGLVEDRKRRKKTPPATQPLAAADAPNKVWSADFKGQFELGDGTMCYPLTVTDNFSRMILGCCALTSTAGAPSKTCFEQIFSTYGLPDAIRTDNGSPFASRAPAGLSRLSAWWCSLGLRHDRIKPGKPQQNGRHERMHLTLKQHTARPAEQTLEAQQRAFDDFVRFFNELRPHESLDQTPPVEHYENCCRRFPEDVEPLSYDLCDIERCVASNGTTNFANRTLYVTEALSGQRIGLIEADVDVWVVNFAGMDIGIFEPGERSMTPLEKPESVARTTI